MTMVIPPETPLSVTAAIRLYTDFRTSELAGYAQATPQDEHNKRISHRECIAGTTATQRQDYQNFLNSPECQPMINLQGSTGHPYQTDVVSLCNAAIQSYNGLGIQTVALIPAEGDPSCVQWTELPDGTIEVLYNYDLDLSDPNCPPAWPLPRGVFRVQLTYRVDAD